MKTIRKIDLANMCADSQISEVWAERIINKVHAIMGEELAKGNEIEIRGFGRFSIVQRKARKGHNIKTGGSIDLPAVKSVKFKQGVHLKKAVNGGAS